MKGTERGVAGRCGGQEGCGERREGGAGVRATMYGGIRLGLFTQRLLAYQGNTLGAPPIGNE